MAHTPVKAPHPKKQRKSNQTPSDESVREAILLAVQTLTTKMDQPTELLKKFEIRLAANTEANNKQNTEGLQKKVTELQEKNRQLEEAVTEQARYKRRWSLRFNGLPEEEKESSRF